MTVILPKQNLPAGTHSGDFPVPAGTRQVRATLLMDATDINNAASRIVITVLQTDDVDENGNALPNAVFDEVMSDTWIGGPVPKGVPSAPVRVFGTDQPLKRLMRGSITNNRNMSIGLDITLS